MPSASDESEPEKAGEIPAFLPAQAAPSIEFCDLAKGGREVLIQHGGRVYHLRLTRNDRLILNK